MSDQPIRFKDHTAESLHELLSPLGVDLRMVRRLQSMVMKKLNRLPDALPEISWRLLDKIRAITSVPKLECVDKITSPKDGFTKYAFRGEGEGVFEAVRIPLMHRPGDEKYIVCVSSQVGCAMGCTFCATGRMGFQRNLASWEIVDQVMHIRDDSPHPVRGVVFMGMGEPMLNYDRVIRACQVMTDPVGLAIDGRSITISTVGIVPGIRRYTAERHPYRLIVSLTAANSEKRKTLFPVENIHPLEELMAAVREYQAATGKRMTLAWTMLQGINISREDAKQLAELTAGMPVRLDLIEVNDATGQYQAPTMQELQSFRDSLTAELGMPIARRYSGGADVHGACGMLAGQLSDPAQQPSSASRAKSLSSLPMID
jgi:23S rRNA (adenine2503-C2)-methyltransferase